MRKWLKTSFWPIFGPNWPIFGPANFFHHLENHEVLDTVILDHSMQNRQKIKIFEQEQARAVWTPDDNYVL